MSSVFIPCCLPINIKLTLSNVVGYDKIEAEDPNVYREMLSVIDPSDVDTFYDTQGRGRGGGGVARVDRLAWTKTSIMLLFVNSERSGAGSQTSQASLQCHTATSAHGRGPHLERLCERQKCVVILNTSCLLGMCLMFAVAAADCCDTFFQTPYVAE